MLAGAHKRSERDQHTEIYLLGLKVQYKHKTKLPLDMVSKQCTFVTFVRSAPSLFLKQTPTVLGKRFRSACKNSYLKCRYGQICELYFFSLKFNFDHIIVGYQFLLRQCYCKGTVIFGCSISSRSAERL